jgi:hypothetical protein
VSLKSHSNPSFLPEDQDGRVFVLFAHAEVPLNEAHESFAIVPEPFQQNLYPLNPALSINLQLKLHDCPTTTELHPIREEELGGVTVAEIPLRVIIQPIQLFDGAVVLHSAFHSTYAIFSRNVVLSMPYCIPSRFVKLFIALDCLA